MTETQIDTDIIRDAPVPGARYNVFLTMHSSSSTSFSEWERQLEELRGVVADHVHSSDWDETQVYGPDAHGFSTPAIAIRMSLIPAELRAMMRELESEELRTWMPRVDLFIATRLNDDAGNFFEMLEAAATAR